MSEITDTISWVEVVWIGWCIIGLFLVVDWTGRRWVDTQYARTHHQKLRTLAGYLLLTVGIGVGVQLLANGIAGIISATVPPTGGRGEVTPQGFSIVILLIIGQAAGVVMMYVVGWIFKRMVHLGEARIEHVERDQAL